MGALAWTGEPASEAVQRNLRALRVLVVGHWAVEWLSWAIHPQPPPAQLPVALSAAVGLTLVGLTGLAFTARGRLAAALAFPLALFGAVTLFPLLPNHTALASMLLGLLALLDTEGEEGELLLTTVRWMTVLIFVWAGVQKVVHGMYFRGEFLAWMIAHGPEAWRSFFGLMVPADEIARVASLPRFGLDIGPYRIASLPLVFASNAVWAGEIGLGVAMLWQRLRPLAALAALGLVLLIQAAPHEWMFALLYSELLLLCLPGAVLARAMPVLLVIYVYLLAALAGAPGASLPREGDGAPVKRRLVIAFLVAFALWPAVQIVLVRSHGADPWRLFAWGMYSVPGSMRTPRIVVLHEARPPRVISTRLYSEAENEIMTVYRVRRQALGDLASADATAEALLALHPDWQGVALPVLTLSLDAETARTVGHVAQFTRWRDGDGPAYEATLETFAGR